LKKFVAIYSAPRAAIEQMMANATPEQMKAGMDAWWGWINKNKASLVDVGAPLGKTKHITAQGVTDTRNEITGYTVVQADTLDAAARLFEAHPHFQLAGAHVEVMEVMPVPSA
jgi:hypothetical protein